MKNKITFIYLLFLSLSVLGQGQFSKYMEEFLPISFSSPVIVNDRLVFLMFTPEYGTELWSTDGTQEGTVLLKDINPGTGSSQLSFGQGNVIDNVLYFRSDTVRNSVYRSDGTPEGTYIHVQDNAICDPIGFIKINDFTGIGV